MPRDREMVVAATSMTEADSQSCSSSSSDGSSGYNCTDCGSSTTAITAVSVDIDAQTFFDTQLDLLDLVISYLDVRSLLSVCQTIKTASLVLTHEHVLRSVPGNGNTCRNCNTNTNMNTAIDSKLTQKQRRSADHARAIVDKVAAVFGIAATDNKNKNKNSNKNSNSNIDNDTNAKNGDVPVGLPVSPAGPDSDAPAAARQRQTVRKVPKAAGALHHHGGARWTKSSPR